MNFKRLFHVLVIGSSVIGCEKARTDALTRQAKDGATVVDDAEDSGAGDINIAMDAGSKDIGDSSADADADTTADADADAGGTDGLPGERPVGTLCLCSPTKCCDQHEGAPATVTPGFVCCWATSC